MQPAGPYDRSFGIQMAFFWYLPFQLFATSYKEIVLAVLKKYSMTKFVHLTSYDVPYLDSFTPPIPHLLYAPHEI